MTHTLIASATVASSLPLFEPMCGASLALCVAYLVLERFRYRDRVRRAAKELLDSLQTDKAYKYIEGTQLLDTLTRLAALGAPGVGPRQSPKMSSSECLYAFFYSRSLDRFVSQAFASYAALILVLGVAHTATLFTFTDFLGDPLLSGIHWWGLAVGMVAPSFFAVGGSFLAKNLTNEAFQSKTHAAEAMQAAARAAQLDGPSVRNPAGE